MKILITGSAGQLGRQLMGDLKRGKTELGQVPACFQNAEITAIDMDTLDIADTNGVRSFFEKSHPDLVLNCAALTNVDACEEKKTLAMQVNAIGPRNLAMAAEEVGAKFLHTSTDYVFSGEEPLPRSEWDSCNPKTVYGQSKLLGEEYAREHCSRTFVVRTAWLYGYYGNNFLRTMVKLGQEKEHIQVVSDQVGNPTNAADLSHHLLQIAAGEEYGIYHCTGKGICSWFDFAKAIMEEASLSCEVRPCTTAEFPRPAPRPAYSALSHTMLKATVGDAMRPWREALHAFFENDKKEQD